MPPRETGTARRSEEGPRERHERAHPLSHGLVSRCPSVAGGRSNPCAITTEGRMASSAAHLDRESRVRVATPLAVHKRLFCVHGLGQQQRILRPGQEAVSAVYCPARRTLGGGRVRTRLPCRTTPGAARCPSVARWMAL